MQARRWRWEVPELYRACSDPGHSREMRTSASVGCRRIEYGERCRTHDAGDQGGNGTGSKSTVHVNLPPRVIDSGARIIRPAQPFDKRDAQCHRRRSSRHSGCIVCLGLAQLNLGPYGALRMRRIAAGRGAGSIGMVAHG